MINEALEYAGRGCAVFPVHTIRNGACTCGKDCGNNAGKHPMTRNGLKDATTDPEQIRRWWEQTPDANIAWALPADVVVVDVDIKHHEGKYGDETLAEWEQAHGAFPDTVLSLTGGGGLQYFFSNANAPVKNGTGLLPSIDVRTSGGYVVLPPSMHLTGRRYEWEAVSDIADIQMAPLPAALYELMTRKKEQAPKDTPNEIPEGTRNDTLFRYAASLRAKGLSELEILAALTQMNKDRCKPPLSDRELHNLVKNAAKYEQGKPYAVSFGESVKPGDYTDVGNAYIFAREYKNKAIYVETAGWLVWSGKVWNEGDLEAIGLAVALTDRMLAEARTEVKSAGDALTAAENAGDDEAKEAATKQKKAAGDYFAHARVSRSKARIAATLELARSMLHVRPEKLDAKPYALNTPGGIVDLKTQKMHPHDPLQYCTKITRYAPGKKGLQMWLDFLETISDGRADMPNYLQQIAGMAAIGKVFEESLIIGLGDGANGKSAKFNATALVLNTYAGTIAAEALTTSKQNKGAELATLKGKRLIIAAELEDGTRLSTSMLKQLTSTDKIHAERKYRDPEDFIPSHTTILYTNHAPRVGSTDGGTWRRLVMVPFTAKIQPNAQIKNYAAVLAREAGEAIMSWIIEGAANFIAAEHTLDTPHFVREATETYRRENDWLAEFFDECCEIGKGRTVPAGILYSNYNAWSKLNQGYARNSSDFRNEMEKRGFEQRILTRGNIWIGLDLTPLSYGYNSQYTGNMEADGG